VHELRGHAVNHLGEDQPLSAQMHLYADHASASSFLSAPVAWDPGSESHASSLTKPSALSTDVDKLEGSLRLWFSRNCICGFFVRGSSFVSDELVISARTSPGVDPYVCRTSIAAPCNARTREALFIHAANNCHNAKRRFIVSFSKSQKQSQECQHGHHSCRGSGDDHAGCRSAREGHIGYVQTEEHAAMAGACNNAGARTSSRRVTCRVVGGTGPWSGANLSVRDCGQVGASTERDCVQKGRWVGLATGQSSKQAEAKPHT
jgi:hypothetical protein